MDRLGAMSVFLTAIECGSFSAAGRRLHKPLTTISRRISELEQYLDVQLFNRSGRQLTLTDAGRSYAEACKRILHDVREVERSASGQYRELKGDLVVTAPLVLGRLYVLPIVSEFLKAYPGINVQLLLNDRMMNMMEEGVDLAIRISNLPDSSVVRTLVGSTRRVVCGSPDYFRARGVPSIPTDVGTHDCVTIRRLSSPEAWTFASGASQVTVPVRSRLVLETAEAAIDAAVAGLGLAFALSFQIGSAVKAGILEVVLEKFEPPPMAINLTYLDGRLLSQKLQAFCAFAAPRLRAALLIANA